MAGLLRPSDLPPPHVRAWFSYAFGAELYSACAAIFVPIMLEKMARELGYIAPDLVERCMDHERLAGSAEQVCRMHILGAWVDTASFSMYVRSLAVIVQALSIISAGSLADSPYWRKNLLVLGGSLSALNITAVYLLPAARSVAVPLLAGLLTTCSFAGYAVAGVCNNAFLSILAKEDPEVLHKINAGGRLDGASMSYERDTDEQRTLLRRSLEEVVVATSVQDLAQTEVPPRGNQYGQVLSLAMSRLSSMNAAIGAAAGMSGMVLSAVPTALMGGTVNSMQLVLGLSGVCYGAFIIPAWLGLPTGSSTGSDGLSWIGQGWRKACSMAKPSEMRALPNLFKYLLAWIFLSDGFHTVNYVSILYASSTLHMAPAKVIVVGVLVFLTATGSSIYVPRLQRRLGCSNLKLLVYVVVLAQAVPLYGCLGLLLPFGGLRTEGEMYVAAAWTGMLLGPFNSYARAVYAEMIPPGHESSFFSLFALTDKSASFIGPFAIGVIADLTGNIRLGFLVLMVLLAAPLPIVLRVHVQRGAEEARVWADKHKLPSTQVAVSL